MDEKRFGFCDLLKKVDVYGPRISVNFRQKDNYQTRLGACLSIITVTFLVTYTCIQLDKLVERRNPDVVTNTVLRDMSNGEPLNAKNERFQFGFVWTSLLDWRFYEHDPRIAIANTR